MGRGAVVTIGLCKWVKGGEVVWSLRGECASASASGEDGGGVAI